MNKYLIPLIITTGIGLYYFCNTKINNIKTLESKDFNKDKNEQKISKNTIKLKTFLESNELEEQKEIKNKSKYQIVVYKKPDGWEIVD